MNFLNYFTYMKIKIALYDCTNISVTGGTSIILLLILI